MQKLVRPPLKRLLTLGRELAFRLGIWRPAEVAEIAAAISEFSAANTPYWTDKQDRGIGILIEGHLSAYGPNYLFRTAIAAKAIQEKTGLGAEVLFNGYSHQWISPKLSYSSFGIREWIHLSSYFFFANLFIYLCARVVGFLHAHRLETPEDILLIKFNSIKVGDLIYDDILREQKVATIDRLDRQVSKCIAKSFFFYLQYRLLFRRRSYQYYVSTHTAYSEYGMLCRVALMHNVKVIETSDIQMALYTEITNDFLPTYHDGIRNSIYRALSEDNRNLARLSEQARESLHNRLDAKIKQLDARKAFRGRVYSRDELKQVVGIRNKNRIGFVLAHIFKDAPHLSSSMLHADYYKWIKTTLEICARSTATNWVVKPHPSSFLYQEDGIIEKMVEELGADNVFSCPEDLNTRSLSLCADGLVTVHGTAGLEFSCLGIPVVIAGQPFYYGFGFAIEPPTRAAYEKELLNFNDIEPLTDEQINKALQVYAVWNNQFDWHNPIVTSEVQALVWGSEVPRDICKAYRLLTDNLLAADPKKLKLWNFVQDAID